ncbi:MAG: Fe2+-dependent dioxygenase [Alsobacter sp.]
MMIFIGNILNSGEIDVAREILSAAPFEDGKLTAGWAARTVKDNEQAGASPEVERLRALISSRILANETFATAVRPKRLTPLVFSRYGAGKTYGSHVDDALMGGLRTDVSFTLFLADPESYAGGELVMEGASGEEEVKLPAGSLVAYPSTTLHRVAPVTAGLRLAAVGWARSYVREAERREILFDLDRARRALFQAQGKTQEFDLLSKSVANLLRMWAED